MTYPYPHPLSYFRAEVRPLEAAATFQDLLAIAMRVLERMPNGVSMVCGPISTGGEGSMEKNLKLFRSAINLLAARGENVFTQMLFEGPMQRLKTTNAGLLEAFYRPIFESGRVRCLCFLPKWRTSEGARWEYERGLELGFELKEFRDDFSSLKRDLPLFK